MSPIEAKEKFFQLVSQYFDRIETDPYSEVLNIDSHLSHLSTIWSGHVEISEEEDFALSEFVKKISKRQQDQLFASINLF